MWRSSLWIAAAITLSGCYPTYPSAPPADLFQGNSRVPSPATRPPATRDYYRDQGGSSQSPTPAAGSSSRFEAADDSVGAVVSSNTERSVLIAKASAANREIVLAGNEDHTDSGQIVTASFQSDAAPSGEQVKIAANGRPAPPATPSVIRIIEPLGGPSSQTQDDTGQTPEPGKFTPAKGAVEITDLPKSDQWTGIGKAASVAPVATTSPQAVGSFGYDRNYSWLKGKLEYARSADRWKLRYIPIDAASDEYGGSVVLPSDSKLAGFQHGDFVKVEGTLGTRDEQTGDYAPQYRVASVKKQ